MIVSLPQGGSHIHFFFDDNPDDSNHEILSVFQKEVSCSQRILDALPKRLIPRFHVPPQTSGLIENELSWLYLLHWLGNQPSNSIFKTHIEFLNSSSNYWYDSRFLPWDQCSSLVDFEPITLLTLTEEKGQGSEYWRNRHREQGKQLPEIIASSLSKPLLYASINAVDLLLQLTTKPSKPNASVSKVKITKGEDGEEEDVDMYVPQLLTVLMKHHKPESGDIREQPLTQRELVEKFQGTWAWSRIYRTMKKIFAEVPACQGMTAFAGYKAICKHHHISETLTSIWLRENEPATYRAILSDQMEKFADKKRQIWRDTDLDDFDSDD